MTPESHPLLSSRTSTLVAVAVHCEEDELMIGNLRSLCCNSQGLSGSVFS